MNQEVKVWRDHVGFRRYDVGFSVGNQTFTVAWENSLRSARWWQKVLAEALILAGAGVKLEKVLRRTSNE